MAKLNLTEVNGKLKTERRAKQSVPPLTGLAELRKATVKLERQARALERQLSELKDSNKKAALATAPAKLVPAKPAPAKKSQTSRTVVVDGKEVKLGPGEEFISLVNPRLKNKI